METGQDKQRRTGRNPDGCGDKSTDELGVLD